MAEKFALILNNSKRVENTIIADESFNIPGFKIVKIPDGIFCQPGMYLNESDGVFYQDEYFKNIYPSIATTEVY